MNLESQICSLELAKRLKELGVKQNSYFVWREAKESFRKDFPNNFKPNICAHGSLSTYDYANENQPYEAIASAFTVAELGELLPNRITTNPDDAPFDSYTICIKKFYSVNEDRSTINNYILNYECDSTEIHGENAWVRRKLTKNIYDSNLANAMARMLIYFTESKLI